jgi:hypothetical protein
MSLGSKPDLELWMQDPTYVDLTKKLDEVMKTSASYRVFEQPQDDVFLL